MSEELLSNDRRVEKNFDYARIRAINIPIPNLQHFPLGYQSPFIAMLQPF